MRLWFLTVALSLHIGCASSSGVPARTSLKVFHGEHHGIVGIGDQSKHEGEDYVLAKIHGAPLPAWREFLRSGAWSYYYPNGQPMVNMTYRIGYYTQCCAGGLCELPYEFRKGPFRAWWPNGQLLAEGDFRIVRERIGTSCQGGATIKRGVVPSGTRFWSEDGSPSDASVLKVANIDLEAL